jgi:putative tricarboxylic transport membrane protein
MEKRNTLKKLAAIPALGLAGGSLLSSAALAQNYPSKNLTMIVPFGAGGGSDVMARTMNNVITELKLLPVKVLVENQPGAQGAKGYGNVAARKGDDHTIATVSVSFFTTPLRGGTSFTYKSFTPVAGIAISPYIMVVSAKSKYKSVADFKNAGTVSTGSTGAVSDPAILSNMLKKSLNITVRNVPFDGEGEVMTELLGGRIDFAFFNPGEVIGQIKSGAVRALAVSTGKRLSSLKDIPTFKELGFDVEHTMVRGVVMPDGVPAASVAYWEGLLRKVSESDNWRKQYIDRFNEEPAFLPAKEFGTVIAQTSARYEALMTELGMIKK